MSDLILPTELVAPTTVNPRKLLLYSKPKAGKTTVVAGLKNSLLVDFEHGSDYISALKVDGSSLPKIQAILKALTKNNPYDCIILDPISTLETIVLPYALALYKKTPMGVNYDKDNVLYLPNGGGYFYLRQAFMTIIERFAALTPRLILTCHLRDKLLEKKGKEVTQSDVDLSGKIRSIICAYVDGIAYLDKQGDECYLIFGTTDDVICGARPAHLRNQEILISQRNPATDVVTTHWDKVFIPNKK